MVVHDYRVKRRTIEELESIAKDFRSKWKISSEQKLDVFKLLFGEVPEALKKRQISLVPRRARDMGPREAYAAPSSQRIFFRERLLAQLRFGNRRAAIIFMHELMHVLMHPGGEKAWIIDGNETKNYISEEESAEWQATMLALLILAPSEYILNCKSAEEIADRVDLDLEHAQKRFDILIKRGSRKIPNVYYQVMVELKANSAHNSVFLADLCSVCGKQKLLKIYGKYRCSECSTISSMFQDGDLGDFEF